MKTARSISKNTYIIAVTLASVFVFCLSIGYYNNSVNALTVSDWNPGKIIDDRVFMDSSRMSVNDIQTFMNTKVTNCDTNGSGLSEMDNSGVPDYNGNGSIQRWEWGKAKQNQTTFTCFKDYHEDGLSSAQIIYNIAKQYNINPQVLLVLLEKEQALITDMWPINVQYRTATGYGCGDGEDCESNYFGLTKQLTWAASMFKAVITGVDVDQPYGTSYSWSNYGIGAKNVLYNPNDICGSSSVNIQNRSASALYRYTPYQPNSKTINWRLGNGPLPSSAYPDCGAFGNINFFTYFNNWFGSTYNPTYSWEVKNLNIYDEGKNTVITTDQLHAGERLWVSLKVKNIGSTTWYRDGSNPATLGTSNQRNHESKYCDTTWLSCNRVAKIKESSVAPGEEGHFEFYMAASNILGEFREYFEPVLENESWMVNNTGFHIYTQTLNDYAWKWFSYDAWLNPEHTIKADVNQLSKNQVVYITVYAKNTSATIWKKNGAYPLRLATSSPKNRSSNLCDSSWLNCSRLASVNEDAVLPGQTASFSFSIKAPSTIGDFREYIRPVIEYAGWTTEDINHMYLRVSQ